MDPSLDTSPSLLPRLNFFASGPDAMRAMGTLDQRVAYSDLEKTLVGLVNLRISQINGCAFCIDRHTADARSAGEDERRLATLSAWRDTPFFSSREQAHQPGRRRSRALPRAMFPTHCGSAFNPNSPRPNSSISRSRSTPSTDGTGLPSLSGNCPSNAWRAPSRSSLLRQDCTHVPVSSVRSESTSLSTS